MHGFTECGRIVGRVATITLLFVVTACAGGEAAPEGSGQAAQAPWGQDSGQMAQAPLGQDSGQMAQAPSGPDAGLAAQAPSGQDAGADSIAEGGAPGLDAAADTGADSAVEAGATEVDAAAASVPDDGGSLPDPLDASGSDARVDAADQAEVSSFSFDSRQEWAASGFRVTAGDCYQVTAQIDDQWLDLDVPADLDGWLDDGDLRAALFAPLRRVRDEDIGFYQLACCVDQDVEQCFAIGEGASICPEIDGELFFFVNDVPGFEDNNVGTATIEIAPSD